MRSQLRRHGRRPNTRRLRLWSSRYLVELARDWAWDAVNGRDDEERQRQPPRPEASPAADLCTADSIISAFLAVARDGAPLFATIALRHLALATRDTHHRTAGGTCGSQDTQVVDPPRFPFLQLTYPRSSCADASLGLGRDCC